MDLTREQKQAIRESLQPHLSRRNTDGVSDVAVQSDLEELVWARQATMEKLALPWIQSVQPLAGLDVLEPGCGLGSMACALLQTGCRLHSYEIDPVMAQATRRRIEILGLPPSKVSCVDAGSADQWLERTFADGVDAVVLMGVLEHIPEVPRLQLMARLWSILRPGGIFVVSHTPNRLTYHDLHATRMPFGHMLPDEIAIRYFDRAPHDAYRCAMEWAAPLGHDQLVSMRHNFGTGLSYHDFELAFGTRDLRPIVADDGLGPEMMAWYRDDLETELLWRYMESQWLPLTRGWARQFLNLIFRK